MIDSAGVEALVAQDGGHVRQPGDGVPQLVASEPVHGPGRLNGVDGVLAVEPDQVEVGSSSSETSCGIRAALPSFNAGWR